METRIDFWRWVGRWAGSDGSWLTVERGRWATGFKEAPTYAGRFQAVDVLPGRVLVDMLIDEGNTRGRTVKAIFRLDGDTLHYCGTYDLPRPTEFVTGERGDPWAVVYTREGGQAEPGAAADGGGT